MLRIGLNRPSIKGGKYVRMDRPDHHNSSNSVVTIGIGTPSVSETVGQNHADSKERTARSSRKETAPTAATFAPHRRRQF